MQTSPVYRLLIAIVFRLSVTTKPGVAHCHVTLEGTRGASSEKVEVTCTEPTNAVVYTNVLVTKATVGGSSISLHI